MFFVVVFYWNTSILGSHLAVCHCTFATHDATFLQSNRWRRYR